MENPAVLARKSEARVSEGQKQAQSGCLSRRRKRCPIFCKSLVPSLMPASHPQGAWHELKGTQVSRKECEGAVPAPSRAAEAPCRNPCSRGCTTETDLVPQFSVTAGKCPLSLLKPPGRSGELENPAMGEAC